jgi:hypothetical protein
MADCPYHGTPKPCMVCAKNKQGEFNLGMCVYHGHPKPCETCKAKNMGAFAFGAPAAYVPPHLRAQQAQPQPQPQPQPQVQVVAQAVERYPHYRQYSKMSCGIEAIRMIYETCMGRKMDRAELKQYLEQRGIYTVEGGALFHALDYVWQRYELRSKMLKDAGPLEIARALEEGCLVLFETREHVIVIDAVLSQGSGGAVFQIRDPAGQDVEKVDSSDARIKSGTGRIWIVRR